MTHPCHLAVVRRVRVDGEHPGVRELREVLRLHYAAQVQPNEERRSDDGPERHLKAEAWVLRVHRQVVR